MSQLKQPPWTAADYERAADDYCRSLPLEHFMEALPQSTQRKITLESLDLLNARRPEVQLFSELLVQYWVGDELRQVVPDNMVRLCREEPRTSGSFNLELEPVGLLMVLEYVSPHSQRKDYEESFAKYEQELKVPYCVMYHPEREDLRVWRHKGAAYERLPPNAAGRYAIEELELEVGIVAGWMRFWHRGELLPLPADLWQRAEEERARAEQQQRRAEQQQRRAEQEQRRAEQQQRRADDAEAEVARLRALLEQSGTRPPPQDPPS